MSFAKFAMQRFSRRALQGRWACGRGHAAALHTRPSPAPTQRAVSRSTTPSIQTSRTSTSATASDSAPPAQKGQSDEEQPDDNIYDYPALYDEAFSFRDFPAEVDFIVSAYGKHSDGGQPLTRVLELGCGPARHSILLALRDYRVTALDASDSMLNYARGRAQEARAGAIQLVKGDMRSFGADALGPDGGPKFDLVMSLLGTFSHMEDNAAARACFASVDAVLRPGGVFLLELAHPGDLFDGTLIIGDGGKEIWEVQRGKPSSPSSSSTSSSPSLPPPSLSSSQQQQQQQQQQPGGSSSGRADGGRRDAATGGKKGGGGSGKKKEEAGEKLLVEWGGDFDNFEVDTQILYRTVTINVLRGDDVVHSIGQTVPYRQYTVQEIDLLAHMHGMEVAGLYGEMDLNVDLYHADAFRLVAVLRKTK